MPDCELLTTCPFFNAKAPDVSVMTERDKEQYCKGAFGWCGRYMAFKARERESAREIKLTRCYIKGFTTNSHLKTARE